MFKNEHEFSRWLRHELEHISILAIPIESHGTRNGIPDLFVMGYGSDIWLELKYVKVIKNFEVRNKITIPYRPGQLAFAMQYTQYHNNKKAVCTVMAVQFKDVLKITLIPLDNETIKFLNERKHTIVFADEAFVDLPGIQKEILYKLLKKEVDNVSVS